MQHFARLQSSAVGHNQSITDSLDFSDLDGSAVVRHVFATSDINESASRLSNLLEVISEQEEQRVRRLAILFDLLNKEDNLNQVLSTSIELQARYQVINTIVKQRNRTHEDMAAQNHELTREQVGDDWFDLYLRRYPMSMVTFWSQVRRLFNIAAQENLDANVVWRTAHAITLQRLRRGGRGIATNRHITRADVVEAGKWFGDNKCSQGITIKDSDLVPNTYLDANNQVWFDQRPPLAAMDKNTLPQPLTQSQTLLHQIRDKRKAEQGVERKRKKLAKLKGRVAASTPSHLGQSSSPAHTEGSQRIDENAGLGATPDRLYSTSIPSIYCLTREWQPTSPQIVPVTPLTEPRLSEWIPNFTSLSQLQRDLIDIAVSQVRWSTNPDIGLVNPRSFESVRSATADQISDAILQLRRLVSYRAPPRPNPGRTRNQAPINPFTAEENGRYFWMLSISQYLSALDLGRDLWCVPDWLSLIHRHLVQLRNTFPLESFPHVPIADDPTITLKRSSLSLDEWQGYASGDLVFNMMRAHALQYGSGRRIQVIPPTVYRGFTESLDEPSDGIYIPPMIADATNIVLIPVHRENHWTLGIIDRRKDQTIMYEINSAGKAIEEPYLRHLLNLNGFDTTQARLAILPGQDPKKAQTTDTGFWAMAHARQFLRNERLAPDMETGQLRLSLIEDLWQGIQGRNTSRKNERRITAEEYTSGLRSNALRFVQAIKREADNGDTRMQTKDPHLFFHSEDQHIRIYRECYSYWGYTLEQGWFGYVLQPTSSFSFNDTMTQETNFRSLPNDETLQSWGKLSDDAHRRATLAAQLKARLSQIEGEKGLRSDQYSGIDWQSLQESARKHVEEGRSRLEAVQENPNRRPTPLSNPPSIRGAESIIDSESSRSPASSSHQSLRQSPDSGSNYGQSNVRGPVGRRGRRGGRRGKGGRGRS